MSQFEDIDEVTRPLPHAVPPEKSVLSSCLQEPQYFLALAIEENLSTDHFYLPAHSTLYGFLIELFTAGIEIELVSLAQRLLDRGLLDRVGGMATVADLYTYAANGGHFKSHLRHVKDKFALRAMIQNANATIAGAYDSPDEVDELLDAAEVGLTAIRETRESVRISGIVEDVDRVMQELDDRIAGKPVERGLNTGFYKLDRMCGGLKPGEVFVVAARPSMGKSSFMMNVVENCITRDNVAAGVFSLEMSRYELTQRLIHSMARFDSGMFRRGETPSGADLMRFRDAAGWVKQNQRLLRIDDTPAITINQLRAKARRMKKDFDIKLIGIDYLQLMKSKSKQAEGSREREISEISGGVKSLAKELGIPILLLAQLNRNAEQRGAQGKEKRIAIPRMSDMRESGCLSVSTTRLLTAGGVQCNSSSRMNTYTLADSGKVVVRSSKNIERPVKAMVRVVLASGRFLDCTPDHRILTDQGWVEAGSLTADHSVASVRKVEEPKGTVDVPEAKWMGWMLGNGSMIGHRSPSFICSDPEVAEEFLAETKKLFSVEARVHPHSCQKVFQYDITYGPVRTKAGNPCKNWCKEHGMWGAKAPEKVVPAWFMEKANNASIAKIIAGLFETDGTVTRGIVKFSTTSNELAWQVVWMLSRLGIFCYLDKGFLSQKANYRCYTIRIADGRDITRFRDVVSFKGAKGRLLMEIQPSERGSNHGDRLGLWVGEEIARCAAAAGKSWREITYRVQGKRINQDDLKRVLKHLPEADHLKHLIAPGIYWDRFSAAHQIDDGVVFDREVTNGPHNFVANGIIVHNCIEQDADLVGLLYREAYYLEGDAKELKSREADLILSKNRGGDTGEIPLVFCPEYTRFETRSASAEPSGPAPQSRALPDF